jgi:ferrous iron transport protein B
MSVYAIGVIFAILTALLLNKTSFKGLSEQFVMELPPYRVPTTRNTLIHMWDKSMQYLQKMATVILVASVIIWALEYFPRTCEKAELIAQEIELVEAQTDITEEEKAAVIEQLEYEQGAVLNENSYIGRFGHAIEPLVRPCGFDWRMGVSLTTGIAAKEVVVSTLAVLFQTSEEEEGKLVNKVRTQVWTDGARKGEMLFTPLVAFGFMLFVLLSTPCFATIAAVRREAGWKGVLFTVFYNTGLAWLVSFLVYQIGSLF